MAINLYRFEFWEILVRIARIRYVESGRAEGYVEGLDRLLKEDLSLYHCP